MAASPLSMYCKIRVHISTLTQVMSVLSSPQPSLLSTDEKNWVYFQCSVEIHIGNSWENLDQCQGSIWMSDKALAKENHITCTVIEVGLSWYLGYLDELIDSKDAWWGTCAMFTAMRPFLNGSWSRYLRNRCWSCSASDAAELAVGRESRMWNMLRGWEYIVMIQHEIQLLTLCPAKNHLGFQLSQAANGYWREMLFVTLVKSSQCTYSWCIGMMTKSYSNSFVFALYSFVNLSGFTESWLQNMHDKRRISGLGEACCVWDWWKKCLPH